MLIHLPGSRQLSSVARAPDLTLIREAMGQVAEDSSSQDKALGPGVLAASASPEPSAAPGEAAESFV